MSGQPSLEGRRFRSVGDVPGGEVSAETLFEYHEDEDLLWARYAGGDVRLGYLVGTRAGGTLDFRYAQVNAAGQTAAGHCRSEIEVLPDGRIRLHETWAWDSKPGAGTSVVEEVTR